MLGSDFGCGPFTRPTGERVFAAAWLFLLPAVASSSLSFSLTRHFDFGCRFTVTCDHVTILFSGKRKALKLNFANPPIKPTTRFTLNTAGPPFQNPHMWVNGPKESGSIRLLISYRIWCLCHQRAVENAQHRVVGKAEDFPGAALGLHRRGSQRLGRDRSRRVRLCQQDGAQAK